MNRILFTLATISIVLLLAAQALGLSIGDLYARPQPDVLDPAQRLDVFLGIRMVGSHGKIGAGKIGDPPARRQQIQRKLRKS